MAKKILFITHWYPNDLVTNKGIFIKKHAQAISEIAKIELIHFDIDYSKDLYKVQLIKTYNDNILSYRIQIRSRFYKLIYQLVPLHYFLLQKAIKKFSIGVKDYNIIHSNIIFPSGIIGYKLSKKYNVPQIHSEHWSKLNRFFKKSWYNKTGLKALANSKKIISVSTFLKKELSNYIDKENIEIIPNVIDSADFKYKEKKDNQGVFHFLCIAHWRAPKNPFYFLEALEKIKQNGLLKFELNIIGTGEQLKTIQSNNYSFSINYLGAKMSNEISTLLNEADFLLHGSDYETFSVVIIEALTTGTPVLVSNIGIAENVINQNNGFICKNDSNDWYEKILKATTQRYNHKNIADEIIGKYELKKIANLFKEIYNKIE